MRNGVPSTVTANATPAAMRSAITGARSPRVERGGDALEADGAARLHQHRVAGPHRSPATSAAPRRRRRDLEPRRRPAGAGPGRRPAPAAPTATTRSMPSSAASAPSAACSASRVLAELEHLAEHRDAPARDGEAGQRPQRGGRRRRARVVGVVEHGDAVRRCARAPCARTPCVASASPSATVVERHAERERDRRGHAPRSATWCCAAHRERHLGARPRASRAGTSGAARRRA